MPGDWRDLRIEPLAKHHAREGFACGIDELDRYLQERARQDARKRIAAPFVLAATDRRVVGYYTLSAFSVGLAELPASLIAKLPRYPVVPATLLGRLAVDRTWRGQGLGEFLLMDALHRSYRLSKDIASYAVVVDAINDAAADFYRAYDFDPFPERPKRLFLPMKKIQSVFE